MKASTADANDDTCPACGDRVAQRRFGTALGQLLDYEEGLG